MIIGSFVDRLNQFISRLYERQWAEWEILTISITVLFVLVWITRRQRKRAVRSVYKDQFLESSPVIGVNLGYHKQSRRAIRDLKKGRLAAVQKRHPKQKKQTKQRESSEKLHEQIKQLQREIIKRKQIEVRLEERVDSLTTANEKLQCELVEKQRVEQQPEKQPIEEPTAEKLFQPEIPESKQAGQGIAEQTAEVSAVDKLPERKPSRRGKKYEDLHRVVDDVKQKLCRKCNEWKPEIEFHKNSLSKDGLAGSCKTCKAEAAKEYRRRRKTAQG